MKIRMDKLNKLIETVSILGDESLPSEVVYQRLTEGVVDLIPEGDYGSLSLVENRRWYFLAAVGHPREELLALDLKREDCLLSEDICIITGIMEKTRSASESTSRRTLEAVSLPIHASMAVSIPLPRDRWMNLTVDIARDHQAEFSQDSQEIFHAFAVMAKNYLTLKLNRDDLSAANNLLKENQEQLAYSYMEIGRLSENLKHMLDLTTQLGNQYSTLEQFYDDLLSTALMVVQEADCGSISFVDDHSWRFITAQGHDKAQLRSLKLDPRQCYRTHEVQVVDIFKEKLIPEVAAASRPISRSMILTLPVGEAFSISFSLDISAESHHTFHSSSRRVFQAFGNLAASFLKMRLSSEKIRQSYLKFAKKLAMVAEAHDLDTGAHIRRVGEISAFFAEKMGLPPELVDAIRSFAPLHDVGKIFIDKRLINKEGSLSDDEFRLMQSHTRKAAQLLDDPYFETARNIAVYHHERYDGKGYPEGLSEDEIPLEAQIVSLADVYDALRSKRSYKDPISHAEVVAGMRDGREWLPVERFSPTLRQLFLCHEKEIRLLYERISAGGRTRGDGAHPLPRDFWRVEDHRAQQGSPLSDPLAEALKDSPDS